MKDKLQQTYNQMPSLRRLFWALEIKFGFTKRMNYIII